MRTLQGMLGLAAVAALTLIVAAPATPRMAQTGREPARSMASPPPAEAGRFARRAPVASVLGISLGMSEERVHGVLRRMGSLAGQAAEARSEEGDEGLEHELWTLDDRRYAAVRVAFDDAGQLRALQAYMRPGGRRLRYREIGDLSHARRLGSTIWQWEVRPDNGRPGRRVVARGADAFFAGSVAMTRLP